MLSQLTVLEHVSDPAFAVTRSGQLRWANQAARVAWGLSTGELDDSLFRLVCPEHHESLAGLLLGPLATGAERTARVDLVSTDGSAPSAFTARILALAPVPPAGSGTVGCDELRVVLLVADPEAEAVDLEQERQRFEVFFHNASDALFIHDRTGRILDANRVAISLFGYSMDELRVRSIGSLHRGGLSNSRKNVDLSVGELLVFDGDFESKHGEVFPARVRVQKVLLGTQQVNVSTVTDTRREALMRAQLIRAEQLEVVSRMAGALAHDFNNLLMVALGGASELLDSTLLPRGLLEVVEDVHRATEQASALASRLTGVARSQQPLRGTTDLSRHLRQTRRMLGTLAGEGVEIMLEVEESPLVVSLHDSQVTQILTNLVANAGHAMDGRGTAHVSARRISRDARSFAVLTVMDEGRGMPPETLERIFEPLFTTKAGGVGTGLGLASVQAILDRQGGVVDVHSEVGKGTTFALTFPTTEPAGLPRVETIASSAGRARGRALVVDDMPAMRGVLARLLRRWGFDVVTAEDGQDGIEQIESHPPAHFSLVVTDMMMPRRSGADLAAAAWSHDAALPIVVLTAYSTELMPRERPGHLRCLSKPVQPTLLGEAIDQLMARAGAGTVGRAGSRPVD